MILYKCDMCGDVVEGESIYDYEMPRRHCEWNGRDKGIHLDSTHICAKCRREIASMLDFVVDK